MMVGTEFVESLVDSRTRGDHWDYDDHLCRRFAWHRPSKELSLTVHPLRSLARAKGMNDRIIELGMVVKHHLGVELGRWDERFSNDGVAITQGAFDAHGITAARSAVSAWWQATRRWATQRELGDPKGATR